MQINNLKKYAININEQAKKNKIERVIGRDQEISNIIRILSRKTKNNPVLIGQPGVGKTAIVEGLALRILKKDVPKILQNKEIYSLDLGALVAGAKFQGEFEERLKAVMHEVSENNDKIILFIDEIHMIIGAGKTQGSMDAANLLKPMLARGELNCIGATTLNEYRENIEKDSAFERRFQKIMVLEPTNEEALSILRGIKDSLEAFHNVKISDEALQAAVKMSDRYIADRFLPDKAIDLIDEACANINVQLNSEPEKLEQLRRRLFNLELEKKSLENEKDPQDISALKNEIASIKTQIKTLNSIWDSEKKQLENLAKYKTELKQAQNNLNNAINALDYEQASKYEYQIIPKLKEKIIAAEEKQGNLLNDLVTTEDVLTIISRLTNIPLEKLAQTEKEKLISLPASFKKRVIGQDKAIKEVTGAIIRSKANLNDPKRPIGSFLFLGPTGVGKTEIAKTLAQELMDNENKIVRIDMSEYMESHSVAKLIGAPPGYIGYEQGGQLTEMVRQNPYSIVLFDEIEKAHPEVLNIMLQILDEGHLIDSRGNKINFKNTIVIMTTNIGANQILENPEMILDDLKPTILTYLKPEIYNRIDNVIKFNALSLNDYQKIIKLELDKLDKKLQEQKIELTYNENVIDYIITQTYSKEFGARPIKRYIASVIENEIAYQIIAHEKVQKIELEIQENEIKTKII